MSVLAILCLILLNGVLAMTEVAFVAARRARLRQQAEAGHAGAVAALALAADPGVLFATVQVGITLVGIVLGVVGEDSLAEPLGAWLATFPAVAAVARPLALAAVIAAITFASLVLGELVPKRIGLQFAEPVACGLARPMRALGRLGAPAVWLLSGTTKAVLRLVGIRGAEEPAVSETDLIAILEAGTRAGVFSRREREMLDATLTLDDVPVAALMTPRVDVVWIDSATPTSTALATALAARFTRFPVAERDLDRPLGIVSLRSLVAAEGATVAALSDQLEPALYIPEHVKAIDALEKLRQTGRHLAFVIDEYGQVEGLLSIHDLLESIVGGLPGGDQEPAIVRRDDGSYLIDGMLPTHQLAELLEWRAELPEGSYVTAAGLVLNLHDGVPSIGEWVVHEGWRLEVADLDGRRIDRLLASRA